MIFSRGLINEYVDIDKISTQDIYKKLNSIGLEVDSLQKYSVPKGVVIGKVLECKKHPDADKLSICKVDIKSKVLNIVCGAKNVREGIFVPVAKIGTILGENEKRLEIKRSELRGVESEGMICSSTEIGLPKIDDGIMHIDESIGTFEIGQELSEIAFFDDYIFEIDLTPNRGDCLNIQGIARELSASFDISLKSGEKLEDEDNVLGIGRLIQVSYEGKSDSSMLYKVVKLNDFKLPLKYKLRLAYSDSLEKNELDSLLEYCTFITGVAMKSYDYDILVEGKSEDFKPLLTIKRDKDLLDSVYCDEKLSVVGVNHTNNLEDSKNSGTFIIEASYIPPDIVSKKVMGKELKKDHKSFYRSSRGSNPKLVDGIDLLCKFIGTYSKESVIYSGTHEITQNYKATPLSIDVETISNIIGHKIQKSQIVTILKNLSFRVDVSPDEQFIAITPPPFRHDIENIQDVTEEIVRIIGIDNIKSEPLCMHECKKSNKTMENFFKKRELRYRSSAVGFSETIHYLFDHREKMEKYGIEPIDKNLEILNPITNELNTLRRNLALNLIVSVERNKNLGKKRCAFFEIGSVYDTNREEKESLAYIFSGQKEEENLLNGGKVKEITFFEFCEKISSIIGDFEIATLKNPPKIAHPYQAGELILNGENIGLVYKLHPNIQNELDIFDTFICEIDFEKIPYGIKKASVFSKYQPLQRDLSVVISKDIKFSEIRRAINSLNISEINSFYPLDTFTTKELGEKISLTIRFNMQSLDRTLEENSINDMTDKILKLLEDNFEASLR